MKAGTPSRSVRASTLPKPNRNVNAIAAITGFRSPALFDAFSLPATLR